MPGKSYKITLSLPIPLKTVPSLGENSPLIEIAYCLKVKAEAEGFEWKWFSKGNEVKLSVPIVLAHSPVHADSGEGLLLVQIPRRVDTEAQNLDVFDQFTELAMDDSDIELDTLH